MSKLVRARVKPVAQWPEWAKCCNQQKRHVLRVAKSIGDFTVDMSKQRTRLFHPCEWCGAKRPRLNGVMVSSGEYAGFMAPFQWLDLDEGPEAA